MGNNGIRIAGGIIEIVAGTIGLLFNGILVMLATSLSEFLEASLNIWGIVQILLIPICFIVMGIHALINKTISCVSIGFCNILIVIANFIPVFEINMGINIFQGVLLILAAILFFFCGKNVNTNNY